MVVFALSCLLALFANLLRFNTLPHLLTTVVDNLHAAGPNRLYLLLRPDDRERLIDSVVHDGGQKVRFLVEGQSSVNAKASFQKDWERIHTSIEAELNPKSMGEFVSCMEHDSSLNSNESEGWLGRGPWVNEGRVSGPGIPPWVDYVFIEETSCGEMDGTKVKDRPELMRT